MPELWLNFTDTDGSTRRVRVEGSRFVIGRHSDCNLAIADSRLSRMHSQIEYFAGRWEISDLGSSNGTELNGSPVFDPTPIYDGSMISLGGLQMRAEIAEARVEADQTTPAAAVIDAPKPKASAAADRPSGRSIPIGLVLAIPVLALVLVSIAGGVAYLAFARNTTIATGNNGSDDPTPENDDPPANGKDPDVTPTPGSSPTNSGPTNLPTPTPANLTETAKVEVNGASFMRKIADNDPRIFLTTDQAKRVSSKIKQLGSSSAVADNLKSAKQKGAELKAIATETNLQPQLLAIAAVTKLGGTRGDVVATARSMSPVIQKLRVHIGTEFADDCLLLIAAYDQGVAGDTMKLRNMLQSLANEVKESSRTIRTIWFLEKQRKITPAEFDRALTFLAIGTLAQNPKDFGVNIDALDV